MYVSDCLILVGQPSGRAAAGSVPGRGGLPGGAGGSGGARLGGRAQGAPDPRADRPQINPSVGNTGRGKMRPSL